MIPDPHVRLIQYEQSCIRVEPFPDVDLRAFVTVKAVSYTHLTLPTT